MVTAHGPVNGDLRQLYQALGEDIHLVAISERQRELARELNWVGMVHNAVRADTFPYQPDKGDYALFLGRFHPDKAPHLALRAAHEVGLRMILAGKCAEPAEQAYFEREVRPLLTERDHVFGVADAAAKRGLLAGAQCLLFPIQWEEPFGMVMIEAMACGTPVVALRGGAVPEIVVDEVTGFVRDDPAELPKALRRLDSIDPAACRQHVLDHFDISALAEQYEAAYHEVLRQRDVVQMNGRSNILPRRGRLDNRGRAPAGQRHRRGHTPLAAKGLTGQDVLHVRPGRARGRRTAAPAPPAARRRPAPRRLSRIAAWTSGWSSTKWVSPSSSQCSRLSARARQKRTCSRGMPVRR